ncbi:MAG TPA: hypothetical protein VEJ20_03110 [Candidatus Eremiobacteraceae bacterium]|nr:hypothetical protein [Candidatus Eremiobacteraceae bacterium]
MLIRGKFVCVLAAVAVLAGCGARSGSSVPASELVRPLVAQSAPPSPWSQLNVPTASAGPFGIAKGSDKNIWYTEQSADQIGRVTPLGVFTEFPLPAGDSPSLIAPGESGYLWFTGVEESGQGFVGSIATATGNVVIYPTPTFSSGPYGIVLGSDGNMWFTETTANQIGKVTPSGQFTEYPVPTASAGLAGITVGGDSELWFAESATGKIGHSTTSGSINEFTGATNPLFLGLAVNKGNNVWFSDGTKDAVGQISQTGTITEYSIPTGLQPFDLIFGADANVWFSVPSSGVLRNIYPPSTRFSAAYTIPTTGTNPQMLAFGSDGNLWFTEPGSDQIGVYDIHQQTATPSSISFTGVGQTQSFSVSEVYYSGTFTVSGCSPQVATVSPSTAATSFTVTAQGAGTCTFIVADSMNNTSPVTVTVTTTSFGIQ